MDGGGGFFRGTSQEQDTRFSDKEKKLLKGMKFPLEYTTKVDMKKVNLEVIKPWISKKVTELLNGFEDEVLIAYIISLLEEKQNPDPKLLQINITGFLATDASDFMLQLWKLLISAQNSIGGIPLEFLEQKKEEIRQRKAEQDRIKAQLSKKHGESINEPQDLNGTEDNNLQDFTRNSDTKEIRHQEKRETRDSKERDKRDSKDRDSKEREHNSRDHRDRESRRRHSDKERKERRDYDKSSRREKSRDRKEKREESPSDVKIKEKRKHRDHEHRRDKEKQRKADQYEKSNSENGQTEESVDTQQKKLEKELREKALASIKKEKAVEQQN